MSRYALPPGTTGAIPRRDWTWRRLDEPMTVAPSIPGAARSGSLEQFRLGITLERRMLLEGTWRRMLRDFGFDQLSRVRAEVVGSYDISSNVYKQVLGQISTLYDRAPQLRSRDTEAVERILTTAKRNRMWGALAQHQLNVNAYRTSLVRYKWTRRGVLAEPVTPDFFYCEPDPEDPSRPILTRQAVWRPMPDGYGADCAWTVDEWDMRDPEWPRFRILTIDADPDNTAPRDDLTAYYIQPGRPSDWWGKRYPYRVDGQPIAPYRHDHARQNGRLWGAADHAEVVHGTLQVGLLMTAFNHAALRASWTQRVMLNGDVPAAVSMDGADDGRYGGRNPQTVEADPTAIIRITDDGRGAGASIDEWGAPVDLDQYLTVVERRAQGLAVHFGLSPTDVVIDAAQTAASGVSIKVSREGQRKIEARQAPIFESYDEQGLEIMAALDRAHAGVVWDARRVRIDYAFTEMDPEERGALLELLQAEKSEGLISKRQMYARLNRCSEEEAAEALLVVAQQDGEREVAKTVVHDPEPADPQAVTTTGNAAVLASEVLPDREDRDAMADSDLARLKAALERFGVEVLIGADVPEGTRGLTTYDAARIDVGPADVADQVIVLAHEGGHWLEHVRRAGDQSPDSLTRERAAYDLGWMLVQALGLDVDEREYRDLHEEALARLRPVERSEAVAIVEDAADAFDDDFREKRFKQPDAVRGNAAKVLRWKDEHGDAVEGMTETGWRRARQLAEADDVSGQDLIEIAAWFARFGAQGRGHYSTPEAKHEDEPWRDAGHVAWEGWGGDSARTWSTEIVERNR